MLKITIVGLGGMIGNVTVDKSSTIPQVKQAMVEQCKLPGWQYQLIDGEKELITLDNLEVSYPECQDLPTAQITAVRQDDPQRDFDAVSDALQEDNRTVLEVLLLSGFHVECTNKQGTQHRRQGKTRTMIARKFVVYCI